jgi:uncharacterized protein
MSACVRRLASSLLILASAFATHAGAGNVIDELTGIPDPATRMERITADTKASFDAALAEYEVQIEQSPYDITAQLRRCRFIDEFTSTYEYATFIDAVYELGEQCQATLTQKYAEHPEVLLLGLERTYGAHLLEEGAKLLRKVQRQNWTNGQLARLYTLLAKTADSLNRKSAAEFAAKALEVDETADVRLIVAARLIERGERAQAIETLTSPIDGSDPKDGESLLRKIGLLAKAGAHAQALALYSKLDDTFAYSHIEAARTLRGIGAVAPARKELGLGIQQGTYTAEDEKERFRFELELGTPQAALTAYDAWRDLGWENDPLAINRVALLMRDAKLPWQARDFLGFGSFLLLIAALAAALIVPLSLVHYRGYARRASTGDAYPSEGWQLRHAWAGLFAFGLASLLALYAAGPIDLTSIETGAWGVDATPVQLARITLAESFLALLLLAPLGKMAATRQRSWWGTRWSIGRSVLVGVAIGCVFRLPLLWAALARHEAAPIFAPDDPIWQLLVQVRDQFGIVLALWMLSIAAPVIEELVFRGVLLKAFSAHIGFGWANVAQAALFSAAHMDLKAAAILFVVGATLGWMTRRSGGLVAPMVMHATFNLIAGALFLPPP